MLLLSGNSRAQAQHNRAKWRLLVLLPTWAIQMALTLTMMALFAWRLGDTMKHFKDERDDGVKPAIEVAWEATNVGLWFVASFCTVFEIAKYFAESLTPWTMLFTHVIKLTCAIATLALDIVVYIEEHDKQYSLIALGLDCAFIVTSLILVFYAIRGYRRSAVYDDYSHPVNVKGFGFHDDLERDSTYSGKMDDSQTSLVDQQRFSVTSLRRSFSSASTKPVELKKIDRTPSQYTHKRDTQFDDYLARRGSVSRNERSMSGDFSWSNSPTATEQEKGIINRPRGTSTPRAPSWVSDGGLVAVQEEDELAIRQEDDKEQTDKKVSQALLGNGPRGSPEDTTVPQTVDVAEPKWQQQQRD